MPREKKRARRTMLLVWLALIIPLVLYLLSFLGDIGQVLSYIWRFFYWSLFGRDLPPPPITTPILHSFEIIAFTLLIGFLATFYIFLLLMSFQALLPVETLDEVFETVSHQITYLMGQHGPAIFVLDGKMDHSADELDRPGPGVIVVNFNSAIVLETLVGRGGCMLAPMAVFNRLVARMTNARPGPTSRVAGPGVVFFSPAERIRSVVDLRKQSRASKAPISAYTRDGIEISSHISTVFTIGQRADILELAYQGDRRLENLKIITTRRVGKNLIEVKSLERETLEPLDLAQAHQYARIPNQQGDSIPYAPVEPARPEPEYDEHRVFKAVYAQARNPQEQVVPWTELPARVAADLYRALMSRINYDELYLLKELKDANPTSFPIPEIRNNFRIRLRNTGILSYRVVFHRSLIPLADGTYNESDLFVSPVQEFTGSQVLRDRGIKVLSAGFSSPLASEEVYKQRLASWRADWAHETELKRAQKDLEALRLRNHARAQAQRDMTQALAEIFERGAGSDEVLALRVLQALEGVAADPKTRQLLPGETVAIINSMHNWLLPGDAGKLAASGLLPARSPAPPLPPSQPDPSAGAPPGFTPPDNVPPPPPDSGNEPREK